MNTFYKKKYLQFSKINNNNKRISLNTHIEELWTYYNEKIDIDSNSFLNKYVFRNIKILALFGEINSIEKDIFKSFKFLKAIHLETIFFGKLCRKGTDWISSINFDLHVNLSNRSDLDMHVNQTKFIFLQFYTIFNAEKDVLNMLQNEDFCLFKNYPFDQLVIFRIRYLKYLFNEKYTCTVQWIFKHIYLYAQYSSRIGINKDTFSDFFTSNKGSAAIDKLTSKKTI